MTIHKLLITPKVRVLQLLETYPQLEEVLIGYVPAFKKLKNPVLRNTVARIATLQQAASVGKVDITDLINVLRKAIGQPLFTGGVETSYDEIKPSWFDKSLIRKRMDAKEVLAKGEQPVNQLLSDLKHLPGNSIYQLTAPFLPAPLIDKAAKMNFRHWVVKEAEETFVVYFFKE